MRKEEGFEKFDKYFTTTKMKTFRVRVKYKKGVALLIYAADAAKALGIATRFEPKKLNNYIKVKQVRKIAADNLAYDDRKDFINWIEKNIVDPLKSESQREWEQVREQLERECMKINMHKLRGELYPGRKTIITYGWYDHEHSVYFTEEREELVMWIANSKGRRYSIEEYYRNKYGVGIVPPCYGI